MPPKQALLCFMNSVSENETGSNRGGLSMLPDVWGLTWEDSKVVDVPVVGGWGHLEASLLTSGCSMLAIVWNLSWAVSPNTYTWSLHVDWCGLPQTSL